MAILVSREWPVDESGVGWRGWTHEEISPLSSSTGCFLWDSHKSTTADSLACACCLARLKEAAAKLSEPRPDPELHGTPCFPAQDACYAYWFAAEPATSSVAVPPAEPSSDAASAAQPSAAQPSAAQPSAAQPSAGQPSALATSSVAAPAGAVSAADTSSGATSAAEPNSGAAPAAESSQQPFAAQIIAMPTEEAPPAPCGSGDHDHGFVAPLSGPENPEPMPAALATNSSADLPSVAQDVTPSMDDALAPTVPHLTPTTPTIVALEAGPATASINACGATTLDPSDQDGADLDLESEPPAIGDLQFDSGASDAHSESDPRVGTAPPTPLCASPGEDRTSAASEAGTTAYDNEGTAFGSGDDVVAEGELDLDMPPCPVGLLVPMEERGCDVKLEPHIKQEPVVVKQEPVVRREQDIKQEPVENKGVAAALSQMPDARAPPIKSERTSLKRERDESLTSPPAVPPNAKRPRPLWENSSLPTPPPVLRPSKAERYMDLIRSRARGSLDAVECDSTSGVELAIAPSTRPSTRRHQNGPPSGHQEPSTNYELLTYRWQSEFS